MVILGLVALFSGGCSLLVGGDMLINGDPEGFAPVPIFGLGLSFFCVLGIYTLRKG